MLTVTMENQTPSRAGWRIVLENPKLFLIELISRWSFGTVALLISIQAFASILQRITISDATWRALHTQDLTVAANAMAEVILAFWRVICVALAALAPALAIAWLIAATWGRSATLRILQQNSAFRVVAVSHVLRIVLVLLSGLATAFVIAGAAFLSTRFSANPSEPNLALYLLIVLVALPVVVIAWAALNWVLSLVPLFSVQGKNRAFASLAAALRSLRLNRSDYWSVSGVYGTLRAIALVAVIALGLILGAFGENWIVVASLIALVLVYFAFADLLYIARLAGYLQIVEQSSAKTKTSPAADATTK